MPDVSYLTAEGAKRLQEELVYLKGPAREALAARLRAAIQMGDLSENADYTAAKEEQGFLEGRIQELEAILSHTIIIDDMKKDTSQVNIGDHVTIQEEDFPEETYHLVGPKEADPTKGRISHESPIGKALLGRRVGDVVSAETPGGSIQLKITRIE
ncbi:transcription elongation factor GreA [Levilinea saccharolytica]|uniref:Transcription elongation factor GreA n=1 Tax=Levilinea saccharolytica TaxID=229921 RepID=A0A0N8GTD9_9CHLR|nr:transcription elongation factor GreA [Levilinea saccharolytica]KPL91826.1 transcription elongation factor GreA [Levilinea saccharolytica]GAP17647.1 transcription elongation factor GreA [Levilinea saccharolytica]